MFTSRDYAHSKNSNTIFPIVLINDYIDLDLVVSYAANNFYKKNRPHADGLDTQPKRVTLKYKGYTSLKNESFHSYFIINQKTVTVN